MSGKTVFISYRRDATGKFFARSLERELTREGYDVFLDIDSIDSGKWAEQILTEVPRRSHFLLLLTPGSLDRCVNEDDWVRQEFETAVKHGRNIVPVSEESVDLGKLRNDCPDSMRHLFDYQMVTIRHSTFDADVRTLIDRYIPPHKAPQDELGDEKPAVEIAPTRLRHAADHLFGREDEIALLDRAWKDPKTHIVTIVAWGGVGKTSLVVEWMARKASEGWPGFDRVFDWSFYSQGTREQGAASGDAFIAKALEFFGDPQMAGGNASPWDKGARLVKLIAQRRSLLVLDGVEPLQHPAGPMAGQLKDPALATMLKGLAQLNPGLCVMTTREHIADLARFNETTAPESDLQSLSVVAGVSLLKSLGVRGTEAEFRQLVEDVDGHALTLNLLGGYLARAHKGDIRRRDQVRLEKADSKIQGGHAFKAMAAYERWLSEAGEEGSRQLAVLRLMGLFDRPADQGCLQSLRREPVIRGLTETLAGLGEDDWNLTLSALADLRLTSSSQTATDDSDNLIGIDSLDAHPLVREYFAKRLKTDDPQAWRSAHRRLYEYLVDRTETQPYTLEGLMPLYQAVAHGCQAGLPEETVLKVYYPRIKRGDEGYSSKKLGAIGSDLGAVACFFEQPWTLFSPGLDNSGQAWLLNEAANSLRALGRLTEALEPMRAGLNITLQQHDWKNASRVAGNLSELVLTLGNVEDAIREAKQSVDFANLSGVAFERMINRTLLADGLHQRGHHLDALERYREAEIMQAAREPQFPLLYSLAGFRYCDLLLAQPERAAWQAILRRGHQSTPAKIATSSRPFVGTEKGAAQARSPQRRSFREFLIDYHKSQRVDESSNSRTCREIEHRASQTFRWVTEQDWLLDIALDQLTLGRCALYRDIVGSRTVILYGSESLKSKHFLRQSSPAGEARSHLSAAVNGLRRAGTEDELPRGLLSRALLRRLEGDADGSRADLDEAWEIAERGPMRLHMADIHLYRARLFDDREELTRARAMIQRCDYWRRKGELEDAEEAAKHWP